MIERRNSTVPVKLEQRENGEPGKIRGVAAVYYRSGDPGTEFQLWRGAVERVMPGAFSAAITRDDVRGLYNHDPSAILGRTKAGTMRLRDSDEGLVYEIEPSNTTTYRDVAEHLRRGDIDGSSFAFRVTKEEWRQESDELEIREIREVELFDVGPVTYPAYQGASSGFRSADGTGTDEARQSHQAWRAASKAAADRVSAGRTLAGFVANLARSSLTARG